MHELKVWIKKFLTADGVSIDELRKRSDFLRKLKNDQFYWCFPCDKGTVGVSSRGGAAMTPDVLLEILLDILN